MVAATPRCWNTPRWPNPNGEPTPSWLTLLLRTEGSLGNTAHAVLRTPMAAAAMLFVLTDVDKDQMIGERFSSKP